MKIFLVSLINIICHRWDWMFPLRCSNSPLLVLVLHLLLREKRACFGLLDFFVWFGFCCFGFHLWFGFCYYLCCKWQFCSLFFFTSVLRRTVTLLTQLAKEMASHAALETQVNDATEAAKKYMAENKRLQEVSLSLFSNFLLQQAVSTTYSGDGLLWNACSFYSFWLKIFLQIFYCM